MVETGKEVSHRHVGTPKPSYTVQRTGPYGFWSIFTSRGRKPDLLNQKFTDTTSAIHAIEQYDPEADIKVTY